MKVTIEPTKLYLNTADGLCRVWKGQTDKGTTVRALVLGLIVPAGEVYDDEVSELMEITRVADGFDLDAAAKAIFEST